MNETTARPHANGTVHAFAAMQTGAALQPHEFAPKSLDQMGVEIQITHCGVCHTDLHLINNDFGLSSYPLVPGHEVVGVVSRLGGTSSGLNVGQRVGVGWLAGACMVCEQCIAGQTKAGIEQRTFGDSTGSAAL